MLPVSPRRRQPSTNFRLAAGLDNAGSCLQIRSIIGAALVRIDQVVQLHWNRAAWWGPAPFRAIAPLRVSFGRDDTMTQGGMFTSLKGYVESYCGRAIAVSSLMGKQRFG